MDINGDRTDIQLSILPIANRPKHAPLWVLLFFSVLLVLSVATGFVYTNSHMLSPSNGRVPSPVLVALIDLALVREGVGLSNTINVVDDLVQNHLGAIIDGATTLSDQDTNALKTAASDLSNAMAQNQNRESSVKAQLNRLRLFVDRSTSWFWTDEPGRSFEILAWAFAGVLVNKLVWSAAALWRGHFYPTGIYIDVAHILAATLTTLVVVWLLSQTTLTISLANNNQVQLDLSKPQLLAAISFVLASAPWGLLRFVRSMGDKLLKIGD